MFAVVRFSLNIKTYCLYVTWEIQDQIWAKIVCIPTNMHSRTLMPVFLNRGSEGRMDSQTPFARL